MIGIAPHAFRIAIAPDLTTAYVPDVAAVRSIALATGTPGPTIGGITNASGIAITPDGKTAYVTGSNGVTPIRVGANTAGTAISLAPLLNDIAITQAGKTAYVTSGANDTVTPINLATNTPEVPIPVGAGPRRDRDHPGWYNGVYREFCYGYRDVDRARDEHFRTPDLRWPGPAQGRDLAGRKNGVYRERRRRQQICSK